MTTRTNLPVSPQAMAISIGAGLLASLIIIFFGVATLGGSFITFVNSSGSAEAGWGSIGTFGVALICICCMVLMAFFSQGVFYGWLAHRTGMPLLIPPMALGGALTTLLTNLIFQIGLFVFTQASSMFLNFFELENLLPAIGNTLMLNICAYSLIYLPLGAAGAAIYTAIMRSRERQAAE